MLEPKLEMSEAIQWADLVTSENWRVFRDFIIDRSDYLNNQALIEIDSGNFDNAAEFRARAKECKSILRLVDERLADLKKKEE